MSAIGNEKNTTIIFPVPVDVMSAFFADDKTTDAKPKKRNKSPSPRKQEGEGEKEGEGSSEAADKPEAPLLRKRAPKRKKGTSVVESEHVVSPPRAFSSGYSLANMMECVVDIDPYESTYL